VHMHGSKLHSVASSVTVFHSASACALNYITLFVTTVQLIAEQLDNPFRSTVYSISVFHSYFFHVISRSKIIIVSLVVVIHTQMYRSGHAKASGGYIIYIYIYTRNCRICTSLGYIYLEMCRFGNFNYIYIVVVVAAVQKLRKKNSALARRN